MKQLQLFLCLLMALALLSLAGCDRSMAGVKTIEPESSDRLYAGLYMPAADGETIRHGDGDLLLLCRDGETRLHRISDGTEQALSDTTAAVFSSGEAVWTVSYADEILLTAPDGAVVETGIELLHFSPEQAGPSRLDLAVLPEECLLRADEALYLCQGEDVQAVQGDTVWSALCLVDGSAYAVGISRSDDVPCLYRWEEGAMEPLARLAVRGQVLFAAGQGDTLFLCTDAALYAYEDGHLFQQIGLIERGISPRALLSLQATEDSLYLLEQGGYHRFQPPQDPEAVPEPTPEPQWVEVGYLFDYTGEFAGQLASFNQSHQDIQVRAIAYASIEECTLQLLSGHAPDLLNLGGDLFQMELYAAKGFLQPLTEFTDQLQDSGAYFNSVFTAAQQQGEVYYFTTSYWLHCYQAPTSLMQGRTQIDTLEELDQLFSAVDEGIYESSSCDTVFHNFMTYALPQFLDIHTGTASFQTEEFYDVLRFCARFPLELTELIDPPYPVLQNGAVISAMTLKNQTEYLQEHTPYGPSFTYIPAPFSGYDGLGIGASNLVAIPANADNPEGAREVLQFLLSHEVQTGLYALPVRRDALPSLADTPAGVSADMQYDALLVELIEGADHYEAAQRTPIQQIIWDEAVYYFSGSKSIEEAAALMQNRAELYLAEQR